MTRPKKDALQGANAGTALVTWGYDDEAVEVLRNTLCKDLNDAQMSLLLYQAKKTGLDPLSRQIYGWVVHGENDPPEGRLIICVGIDGLRSLAEGEGERYMPGKTELKFTEVDGKKVLVSATVSVWRKYEDGWKEFSETAYLHEYAGKGAVWKRLASVLLAKCAEARVIRRVFPKKTGNLYAGEELHQAHNDPISGVIAGDVPRRLSATQGRVKALAAAAMAADPPEQVEVVRIAGLTEETRDSGVVIWHLEAGAGAEAARRIIKELEVMEAAVPFVGTGEPVQLAYLQHSWGREIWKVTNEVSK